MKAALLALVLCASGADAANVLAAKEAAYSLSLNGDWSFKYIAGQDAGADAEFTSARFDASRWNTIPVPANWELKGFAEPSYADELKDGLGLYRRSFLLPSGWQGRRVFLRFEGVAFGYELWVNGRKAGASAASAFNRHTFDVTEFLQPGDAPNRLAVRVASKPLGYEFDLNDDWSLSGIYRDVTLFSVPDAHIAHLATSTRLLANGAAEFSVDVELSRNAGQLRARLIAPDGTEAAHVLLAAGAGQGGTRRKAVLRISRPSLWTAETPSLYRLQLTLADRGKPLHAVEERVGLREVRIDGKVLLLNGRPVKLRGVNHHDLDPLHGRAITEAQMRTDLELMKKANVNFVRTSHYPPNVRLLELADEMGFYVMDEVSIGHGEKNLVKPAYRDNILARVEPTIARDRNRASVLIWSIGNENPLTEVELEAGRLAKQLDPSRPITYPKIGSYFAANYQKIPDWVDVHAPHYPTNARLADYAATLNKPTIVTEYAHALGLATDRLQEQWETIQQSPVLAGGAVWHFMDQGILRTSAVPADPSRPTQYAWLDQARYYDTHGLDGTDGVVYADRTPQTDYWQMRKVYAPVRILEQRLQVKPGRQEVAVTVESRYDFRALGGIGLHWSLQRNGEEIGSGKAGLGAAARGRETVDIPLTIPLAGPAGAQDDVLVLQLRAVDERGMQINERSVRLERLDTLVVEGGARGGWTAGLPPQGQPVVSESMDEIRVALPQWVLTVQRSSGAVAIRDQSGRVLVEGIYPHSGRKPLMAEALRAKLSGLWLKSMLTRLEEPAVTVQQRDGKVLLAVSGRYPLPEGGKDAQAAPGPQRPFDDLMPGAQGAAPGAASVTGRDMLRGGYQLEIAANGVIAVSYAFAPAGASGLLSEAGLSVVAPPGLDEFRWIGQGPYAGYPGKDALNEFGLYHLNRSDLRFQGNRRGTELALLSEGRGAGFALAMQPGDVAVERDGARTLLSHNAIIGGLGNKGTTPEVTHLAENTPQIAGAFSLVPLAGRWPARLVRWFGEPAPAKDVFKPFFHSYDQ
jgi:beta-galactosidase